MRFSRGDPHPGGFIYSGDINPEHRLDIGFHLSGVECGDTRVRQYDLVFEFIDF
jgi:hypothetical protein